MPNFIQKLTLAAATAALPLEASAAETVHGDPAFAAAVDKVIEAANAAKNYTGCKQWRESTRTVVRCSQQYVLPDGQPYTRAQFIEEMKQRHDVDPSYKGNPSRNGL
jgi:hypothetical protein